MKKISALVLALVLVLCCAAPAMAAGKLEIEAESFILIDTNYSDYVYGYAKVVNSGDKAIKVNDGLFEIYDSEGEAIDSTDWLSTYAEYLQPGEYTYVSGYFYGVEDLAAIDDHVLDVSGKSDNSKTTVRLPVETELALGVQESAYWTRNWMYVTYTNNTNDVIYGVQVVAALLDAEGKILYMDSNSTYNCALTPGSSMIVRMEISDNFMQLFEKEGLTPATVDAIAYANVSVE